MGRNLGGGIIWLVVITVAQILVILVNLTTLSVRFVLQNVQIIVIVNVVVVLAHVEIAVPRGDALLIVQTDAQILVLLIVH
jgi:hypothetical protein